MKIALGLIVLFSGVPRAWAGDHDGPQGRVTLPPKPANSSKDIRSATDLKLAEFQHLIYLDSGDPVKGDHNYAFGGCNGLGYRVPNIEELEAMATTHKDRLFDKFKHSGCLWAADPVVGQSRRFSIYSFDINGRGWGDEGFKGCSTVCLNPRDPIQDMIDLCPVGNMDYCEKGKTQITNCDGDKCIADFRCICGDFALAFGRCLRKKMGKKSWHVYSHCTVDGKNEAAHETNVVQVPYPHSSRLKKFCSIEPQRMRPGGNPQDAAYCCWLQEDGEPKMSARCQQALCLGLQGTPYVEIRKEGQNYYDSDFTASPSCTRHFQYKTGIDGKHLTPD